MNRSKLIKSGQLPLSVLQDATLGPPDWAVYACLWSSSENGESSLKNEEIAQITDYGLTTVKSSLSRMRKRGHVTNTGKTRQRKLSLTAYPQQPEVKNIVHEIRQPERSGDQEESKLDATDRRFRSALLKINQHFENQPKDVGQLMKDANVNAWMSKERFKAELKSWLSWNIKDAQLAREPASRFKFGKSNFVSWLKRAKPEKGHATTDDAPAMLKVVNRGESFMEQRMRTIKNQA